jgi:hypothetical protein
MADLNDTGSSLMRLQRCKQVLAENQCKLKLCEKLHYFGDMGEFGREFLAELRWLRDVWMDRQNEELFDAGMVADIEDRLERIPFKDATSYKCPVDECLANICLDENAEWRNSVCSVMSMTPREQLETYERFEYMCNFIINAREELLFDIESQICE